MPSYAVPGSQSVQTSEKGRQAVEKKTSEKQREERRGDTSLIHLSPAPQRFSHKFSRCAFPSTLEPGTGYALLSKL